MIGVLGTLFLMGCSSHSNEGRNPADPLTGPPVLQERDPEWYAQGQYLYDAPSECTFVPAASTDSFPFDCSTVLVGLKVGVTAAEVDDLLQRINGSLEADRSGGERGWIVVRVPPRTEREAIIEAFRDERTRYAALNFTGPAQTF